MNFASPQLCEELHDLSGWASPHRWDANGTHSRRRNVPTRCPAYDLGLLMRRFHDAWERLGQIQLTINKGGFTIGAMGYYAPTVRLQRNPEDAACKLAIELFKQGVLLREAEEATV